MRRAIAALAFGASTLAVSPADATVMIRLDLAAMASQATDVVRARVVLERVVLEKGDQPWTETHLQVLQRIKGKSAVGSILRVHQIGGEVGNRGLWVPGTARLQRGDEVVIMLRAVGSVLVPVGMSQGVYYVRRDKRGVDRVKRDLRGLGFAERDAAGKLHVRPEVVVLDVPDETLTGLLARLQRALSRRSER